MNRLVFLIVLLLLPAIILPGTAADGESGAIDLDSVGYLQVQSSVEGARVYFDRVFMGFIQNGVITIPLDVTANPLYADLILEYTGYRTYTGPLPQPVAGRTVGVSVELNKTGYEGCGIIQFESGLPGTELLLNGVSKGFTPDSGSLMLHTVPAGLYNFTVRRPGNLTLVTQQYVSSNAVTVYRVNLEPALTGDMQINTTPEGAGIYLDNRYEGVSPLRIPDVPVGNKTVRVTREGYQDWNGEHVVIGGESNQVDVVLVSTPPTPIPHCPPVTPAPLPLSAVGESTSGLPNNLILFAGMAIVIGLIACIALVIWEVRRKKGE